MKPLLHFLIIGIPLFALFVIGGIAALVCDLSGWLEDLCREWFTELGGGG